MVMTSGKWFTTVASQAGHRTAAWAPVTSQRQGEGPVHKASAFGELCGLIGKVT